MSQIPEVQACADYQLAVTRRLNLGRIAFSALTRKLKIANFIYANVFRWLGNNPEKLDAPVVEIVEAFRKTYAYRICAPMDQTIMLEVVRHSVLAWRENQSVFFQLCEVADWSELANHIEQLGVASANAYAASVRGNAHE